MGHVAGDELIKGAAECLLLAIGNKGRVYRTGGDEFASILYTDTPELVRADIAAWSGVWRGRHSEAMSISVGYASHRDYPDLGIRELEKLADEDMYRAKAKHYEKIGYDRAPAAGGLV
jgi:diguanylate cyclase (GGDEF)-like protein